ncbi:MAG: UDP-N-acetylglucosamine 2-epimerase [Candidatus Melainabacteria bacterium]
MTAGRQRDTRTVAVFTGNRAEYGLLFPILKAIDEHPALSLQLYVGGDHLSTGTVREIEADGFAIASAITNPPILYDPVIRSHAPTLMCQTTISVMQQLQPALLDQSTPPDWFFVLGDRFESYAAALTAFYCGIPVAHLGGGDVTEGGCVDDILRFSLTDLAAYHFAISEDSAQRLKQRGEEDWRIAVSGSPVIDNIAGTVLVDKAALCREMNLDPAKPIALLTQHPLPSDGPQTVQHLRETLDVLQALGETEGLQTVATHPNCDAFAETIERVLSDSRAQHSHIRWVDSLGRQKYLSWIAACDVVVGNSSSGLIETPFFHKPSVSIGNRQAGRLCAANVLRVLQEPAAIRSGTLKALTDHNWRQTLNHLENPFGQQPCAPLVCDRLANLPMDQVRQPKRFAQPETPRDCAVLR